MKFFTSEYTEKNARYWAAQRELGRWKWVLLYGVCAYGGILFMLRVVFELVFLQGNYLHKLHLAGSIVVSLLTGLIFGLWLWYSGEKSYEKYMNSQIAQDSSNKETK